jgi:DNA-binding transcriptional ArsR family regulator
MAAKDPGRVLAAEDAPFSLADEPTSRAVALLKVLSHEHRLRILCELVPGERSVAALGELTGIVQPYLGRHLRILQAQGLVLARRHGRESRYALCSPAAAGVVRALHASFCGDDGVVPESGRKAGGGPGTVW